MSASRIGSRSDGNNVLHTFQDHLAKVLGHSNITLTPGTYSHLVPQLEHDAADRMDAILAPAR